MRRAIAGAERGWLDSELARVVSVRRGAASPPPPPTIPAGTIPAGAAAGTYTHYSSTTNLANFANTSGEPGMYAGPSFTDADVRRLEHPEEF